MKLKHKLDHAEWDEEKGIWNVQVRNLETGATVHDWGHVVINGTGILK